MKPRRFDEKQLIAIAADTIVLILFFVLLCLISAFACLVWFLLWLTGVV